MAKGPLFPQMRATSFPGKCSCHENFQLKENNADTIK